MNRRELLKAALQLPVWRLAAPALLSNRSLEEIAMAKTVYTRVRPGQPMWPSDALWAALRAKVGGRLHKLEPPFVHCNHNFASGECNGALSLVKNPYYLGDQPALTETSGWVDAWISQPSVYVVTAKNTADVVAAVNFAREHNLRVVIKGGGHSYQGTSNAPDSLLVWTRDMNSVTLHNDFIAQGCTDVASPQPAVSVGAGCIWMDVYDMVTTRGGRYVQGGACTTVGVAGLVQSGGFNSFSKNFGTAAGGLLEAEIVTANGQVCVTNARMRPDLFWGIKGGGGGSLGVVTRMTLRTRELPVHFGAVLGVIKTASDLAFRELIGKTIAFYESKLFNSSWGEHMTFGHNSLQIVMFFQGVDNKQVDELWAPFLDWLRAHKEYVFAEPVQVLSVPAQHFWDGEYMKRLAPQIKLLEDDRPNASRKNVFYEEDRGEVGWFVHGYQSAWLPSELLNGSKQSSLSDALYASTRYWPVQLFFSKGLAGAPLSEIHAARDTATNPKMLEAFALAICSGGNGTPAFLGMPGDMPDMMTARSHAEAISMAMGKLLAIVPKAGSYLSESDYFISNWREAFWGENYTKLAAVKKRYDPQGLFFVRHGVGSEDWSTDGFTYTGGIKR